MSEKEIVYKCGCVSTVERKKCIIHGSYIIAVSGSNKKKPEVPLTKISKNIWVSNTDKLPFKQIAKKFDVVLGKASLPIEATAPNFVRLSELKGKNVAYIGCKNLRVLSYILENCKKVFIDSQLNIVDRVMKDPDIVYSMKLRTKKE